MHESIYLVYSKYLELAVGLGILLHLACCTVMLVQTLMLCSPSNFVLMHLGRQQ